MGQKGIANPSVIVNNVPIAIEANSFSYTEGFGDATVRVQSAGGNSVESVLTENVESKCSQINFSLLNTPENIELQRTWKNQSNENNILVTADGGFSRAFNNAIIISDTEVQLQTDGNLAIEWKSDAAI